MSYRILFVILSVVFVSGCASSPLAQRRPTQANNLQFKIAQMERQLNEREQETQELRYEIDRLSAELEAASLYKNEPIVIEEPAVVDYNYQKSAASSSDDEQIIRVNASPKEVQKALKSAGYYTGPIDGKIGRGSKKAIKEFQTDHNLKADGIIGKKTWIKLATYIDA